MSSEDESRKTTDGESGVKKDKRQRDVHAHMIAYTSARARTHTHTLYRALSLTQIG